MSGQLYSETELTCTFGKSYCSKEIDLHDLPVYRNVCLHGAASGADSCVVDQNVHTAKCLQRFSHLLGEGGGEGEVEGENLGRETRRMGGLCVCMCVCVHVQVCRK